MRICGHEFIKLRPRCDYTDVSILSEDICRGANLILIMPPTNTNKCTLQIIIHSMICCSSVYIKSTLCVGHHHYIYNTDQVCQVSKDMRRYRRRYISCEPLFIVHDGHWLVVLVMSYRWDKGDILLYYQYTYDRDIIGYCSFVWLRGGVISREPRDCYLRNKKILVAAAFSRRY